MPHLTEETIRKGLHLLVQLANAAPDNQTSLACAEVCGQLRNALAVPATDTAVTDALECFEEHLLYLEGGTVSGCKACGATDETGALRHGADCPLSVLQRVATEQGRGCLTPTSSAPTSRWVMVAVQGDLRVCYVPGPVALGDVLTAEQQALAVDDLHTALNERSREEDKEHATHTR